MKVLITGAAGRIGAHLTRYALEAGHEVRAFVVPGDPRAELIRLSGVELFEGDLRDRDALQRIATGVDAIFHLAGALTSRGNTDREFIELNLNATFDLLRAARAGSPNLQRFAYASSDAVYAAGGPAESLPIDESSPVQPGSVYGATKAGAEQLCLSFWRSEGFPATILRFGATCDAHELIDPNSVFARWLYLREASGFLAAQPHRTPAQDETLRILTTLDTGSDKLIALTDMIIHPEVRQWGDARDVADGCLRTLGNSAADGEIFDLGGGPPFTTHELATVLSRRTGMPMVIVPVPTARPPWFLSSARAKSVLGYEPRSIFTMVDDALASSRSA